MYTDSLMRRKYVVGVDIGFQGAVVILKDGEYLDLLDMPVCPDVGMFQGKNMYDIGSLRKLCDGLLVLKDVLIVIEKPSPRPRFTGASASSNWWLGAAYMLWVSLCECYDIDYTAIRPQEWQKEMFKSCAPGKGKTKENSFEVASLLHDSELFIKKATRKNAKDRVLDGRCDAFNIAKYVWGKMINE